MRRYLALLCAGLFYFGTLVQAAEVRKLGISDMLLGPSNSTWTSPAGKVVRYFPYPYAGDGTNDNAAVIDVRAYGAVAAFPYGGTPASYADQTSAFQAAIDNAAQYGRGTVIVPNYNGLNYLIKGTLTLKRGVSLVGTGNAVQGWIPMGQKGQIYHSPTDNTINLFELEAVGAYTYSHGQSVENLTIESSGKSTVSGGTGVATSNRAFSLNKPSNFILRNVYIYGFTTGLWINYGIECSYYDSMIVAPVSYGIYLDNTNTGTTTQNFYRMYVSQTDIGVRITDAQSTAFYSSIIETCTTGGVLIDKGNRATFVNQHMENIPSGAGDGGYYFRAGLDGSATGFGATTFLNVHDSYLAGPSATPNLTTSVGIQLGDAFAEITGTKITRVARPMSTTADTKRVYYNNNSHVTIGSASYYKASITDWTKIIGYYPANHASAYENALYGVSQLQLNDTDVQGSWKVDTGSTYDSRDIYFKSNAVGDNAVFVVTGAGYSRTRRNVLAPTFTTTTSSSQGFNNSATASEWCGSDNTIFATGGTYAYMGTGAFAVVKCPSDSKWYIVVINDGATGVRTKQAIDTAIP